MVRIIKVISGGQTGADQAGIFAAASLGIPTGGAAPKGWRTQKGAAPWLAEYGLVEHPSPAYPPRTRANVEASDLTIIFGDPNSPGCKLTRRYCNEASKPYCLVRNFNQKDLDAIFAKLYEFGDSQIVINIAGNREESSPGIEKRTVAFLQQLLSRVT